MIGMVQAQRDADVEYTDMVARIRMVYHPDSAMISCLQTAAGNLSTQESDLKKEFMAAKKQFDSSKGKLDAVETNRPRAPSS